MKKVFLETSSIEKQIKENLSLPDFLMMENAAIAIKNQVLEYAQSKDDKVIFLCGKGNNGADGFASARLLQDYLNVLVFVIEEPVSIEAKKEYEIAQKLGIQFITEDSLFDELESCSIIVDCIYGTRFHDNIEEKVANLIQQANSSPSINIACDIPSGIDKFGNIGLCKNTKIAFKADVTVTMGSFKTALLGDDAKNYVGKIVVADLGLSRKYFESINKTNTFLLEKSDMNLPFRKEKSVNKGTFGYTTVISGEKTGASILSATTALHFGSGIVSLLPSDNSNINQFKISPELIISSEIPVKTTSVVIGCGLGNLNEIDSPSSKMIDLFKSWFLHAKNPACVIDADLFYYKNIKNLLLELSSVENARIVLTPHPKELLTLCKLCGISSFDDDISAIISNRMEIAKEFHSTFPKITLVMKGANTIISSDESFYICNLGSQNLAKAGSGDVLAGLIGSLLAQNYSSKEAAITAVLSHSTASSMENPESFSLTPERLIENISKLF